MRTTTTYFKEVANIDNTVGVYKITCAVTGKYYIGSSIQITKRKRQHFARLRANAHNNTYLQNAFNKYGESAFNFEMVEEVKDEKILLEREQYYIDSLKAYDANYGYNAARIAGANFFLGCKHSDESKIKMSKFQSGKFVSEETKARQKLAHTGKPSNMLGKKHSQESKERMAKTRRENPTPEKVKHKSKEWRENMSKSRRGKQMGAENPSAKKVVQLDANLELISVFNTMTEAREALGININSIVGCCKGRLKTGGGFKWMYYADYLKTI